MGSQNLHTVAHSTETSPADGPKHSQELANQLVRHLGIQGATQTCIENHWQGVLDIIRAMNRKQ